MINTVHGRVCTGNIDTCLLDIITKTFENDWILRSLILQLQLSLIQLHNIVVSGRIENALLIIILLIKKAMTNHSITLDKMPIYML